MLLHDHRASEALSLQSTELLDNGNASRGMNIRSIVWALTAGSMAWKLARGASIGSLECMVTNQPFEEFAYPHASTRGLGWLGLSNILNAVLV